MMTPNFSSFSVVRGAILCLSAMLIIALATIVIETPFFFDGMSMRSESKSSFALARQVTLLDDAMFLRPWR